MQSQRKNISASGRRNLLMLITILNIALTACGTLKPNVSPIPLMDARAQPEIQIELENQSQLAKHAGGREIRWRAAFPCSPRQPMSIP